MPIYEYQCKQCTTKFDVLQRIDADSREVRCPECGAQKVEKQFSAFATAGSGSGFTSSGSRCGTSGFS